MKGSFGVSILHVLLSLLVCFQLDDVNAFCSSSATRRRRSLSTTTNQKRILSHNDHSHLMMSSLWRRKDAENKEQNALVQNGAHENDATNVAPSLKKKKNSRSIALGVFMGMAVAMWVFSGNLLFTLLFAAMTIMGQWEYYHMVMSTGVVTPARKISVVGACSMFLTAYMAPETLHPVCLPLFGMWSMVWFLVRPKRNKKTVTTLAEIATTFTGMFYLGYVPSFWVRIRILGSGAPAPPALASFVTSRLPPALSSALLSSTMITTGTIFIFWTWLSLAFNDVAAYFGGRKYGHTKLSTVFPNTPSPNKTVQGMISGCTLSAILSIVGAHVQHWPYPWIVGGIHGAILGFLGLLGDLTASMMKRDAGLKDFGTMIPQHGGILDRVDGFVWSAPYAWLMVTHILPLIRKVAA